MTDIHEPHAVRTPAVGDAGALTTGLVELAGRLLSALKAPASPRSSGDVRAEAERARRAEGLKEKARRDVDRLLML
jgi:hypothetical protein